MAEALAADPFPVNTGSRWQQARRRFVYQELLVLQLALALRRHAQTVEPQAPAAGSDGQDRRPHSAAVSVRADGRPGAGDWRDRRRPGPPVPMNRLLQGDVGSGKTVVAVYAMLLAVAHGHQAALMAPTEILARQHCRHARPLLVARARSRWRCSTGGLTRRASAQQTLATIAAGEIDVVIGTHAIISGRVEFAKLGWW